VKFDDFDKQMRVYETTNDTKVLPGIWIVSRLDGRNFTRLCRETVRFNAPFDERFRDLMTSTTAHLMDCGFKVVYGYTQSDEISLLFDFNIDVFGRKARKYISILAAEASAKFSLMLNEISPGVCAVFDCRLCQLPGKETAADYFRWRAEDAHRNALNSHCYWLLRKENMDAQDVTRYLEGKTVAEKNELLFSRGINYNDLPAWQKRGIGLYRTDGKIKIDYELPFAGAYGDFLMNTALADTQPEKAGSA